MKKILFVIQSLHSGGSITSLLNLLRLLKEKRIETDLFLMEHDGVFMSRAKDITNLLPEENGIASVICSKNKLRKYGICGLLNRAFYVMCHRLFGTGLANKYFYQKSAKKLSGKYDVVIAYQESMTTEYVQFIQADNKIAWCHMDLAAFSKGKTLESQKKLYDNFSKIVCVSDYVKRSMIEGLNIETDRICKIYNTIPVKPILDGAKEIIHIKKRTYTFLSMGRFVKRKNFDRVVFAASKLKEDKISFIWYILGDGEEHKAIKDMIEKYDLQNEVILLGVVANPFPYVKEADAFVLTSETEAQPMVLNEALTLGIPVISTRFASALEVVDDGVNGIVVDNSSDGVLYGVRTFINDNVLRNKIKKGAELFEYDNDVIISQVIDLL